jgi:hypothetical protein
MGNAKDQWSWAVRDRLIGAPMVSLCRATYATILGSALTRGRRRAKWHCRHPLGSRRSRASAPVPAAAPIDPYVTCRSVASNRITQSVSTPPEFGLF